MNLTLSLPSTIVTGTYQHGLKKNDDYETRQHVIENVARFYYGPNKSVATASKHAFHITLKTSENPFEAEEQYSLVAAQTGWEMGTDWRGEKCLIARGGEVGCEFVIIALGECWQMYELVD